MSQDKPILGLHHMTAICADAQANVDFYAGVLGLRVTKVAVNFDDPGTYHLYYGDNVGSPGTSITFFPYPDGHPVRHGTGEVVTTALAVPANSLGFWTERLKSQDVAFVEKDDAIAFEDRDGIGLELVATERYDLTAPVESSPVPVEHQIAGMAGITVCEEEGAGTASLLTGLMAFDRCGTEMRFQSPNGDFVQALVKPDAPRGRGGPGSVHHVAFRIADDPAQAAFHKRLLAAGYNASPIIDRTYFHSVYFREPGGVLFEIATDGPGFLVDEAPETLGHALKLPPRYEPYRERIVQGLPPLRLPDGTVIGG